jgi:peroxiredoxin
LPQCPKPATPRRRSPVRIRTASRSTSPTHVGKKIVLLYFYPKDFTGGCTKEACGFRDRMGDLQTNNVEVIGVSHDSVDSHKKFADENQLNFTLVADPTARSSPPTM